MTAPRPDRAYPIPAPVSDSRFTFGLTIDVARILAEHGFPPITAGGDLVALQQALFGFLYAPTAHDDPDGFGYSRDLEAPDRVMPEPGIDGHDLGRVDR